MDNIDLVLKIGTMILTAGVVYGAIRNDIKNIHEQIQRHEKDIDKAHTRIDELLMKSKGQ